MLRLYLLFAAIYLIEGVTEVPFILNVYLRNILEFEPSQIGGILFLGGMWFVVIKPLVGLVADSWKRFSTRAMLVFGVLCSSGGWALIANASTPLEMTVGVSLKIFAIACLDVLIDGMIVAVSTAKNRTLIQSLVFACRFGGSMLTANIAGAMIGDQAVVFIQIFYFYSLLALAALVPVLIYSGKVIGHAGDDHEQRRQDAAISFRERLAKLKTPGFGWLVALLFLFSFGADTSTYMQPLLEERFSGDFLGRTMTIYYAGLLIGILLMPLARLRVSVRTLLIVALACWSTVELSSLSLLKLEPGWMTDVAGAAIYFAGGLANAASGISLLIVATAMCKIKGVETFAFAAAISVKNLTDQSAVLFGGYLMEWVGIEWLFVISATCGLLPFLVLFRIDYSEV